MHNLPLRSCLTHLTESLVPQLLRVHHACPACRRRHRHKAAASVHAHSQVGLRTLPQSFGQVLVSPDSPASSVEEAEGLVRRRGKEFVQQLQKRVSDELPRLPFSRCVWARAGVRVYLCARAHVCVCMRVCVCICVLKCMRMCVRVCEQGCRAVADHPTHLSPTPEAPASTASALSRRPCWGHQAVGACSCPHGAQPVWLGQLGGGVRGCPPAGPRWPGGPVPGLRLQGRSPRKASKEGLCTKPGALALAMSQAAGRLSAAGPWLGHRAPSLELFGGATRALRHCAPPTLAPPPLCRSETAAQAALDTQKARSVRAAQQRGDLEALQLAGSSDTATPAGVCLCVCTVGRACVHATPCLTQTARFQLRFTSL